MKTSHPFSSLVAAAALGVLTLTALPDLAHAQGVMTVLHSFLAVRDGGPGGYPTKGVTFDAAGNIYGVTPLDRNDGTIYKIAPDGTFTTLLTFTGANGSDPDCVLLLGTDGLLYGTTEVGGPLADDFGTVFRMDTNGGSFQTLHVFSKDDNPNSPTSGDYVTGDDVRTGLTLGPDGNYYGTTYDGGGRSPTNASSGGTIFQVTPAGNFRTIYSFNGAVDVEGKGPAGRLALDADGSLYGTDSNGGADIAGAIFKVTPAGALTYLHFFNITDGANALAGVTLAPDGNYYGSTEAEGGPDDLGTYYRISRTGDFTLLGSFTRSNGSQPFDEMVLASDGNLYGTTYEGGVDGEGEIFQLTPAGALTIVYNFPGGNSPGFGVVGYQSQAGLVQGPDGRLYGTTTDGGANNDGTVFAFSLNPVITSAATAAGTVGQAFQYQITGTNTPTTYAATPLPGGLAIDTNGLISGTPTQVGTFAVNLAATNGMGTGGGVLTLTVAANVPTVSLVATVPSVTVGSGEFAEFTVSLSAVQDHDVTVNFTIKGSATNGTDYELISASKKIKAGKLSKPIKIIPQGDLGGVGKKTVVLSLVPGDGYTVAAAEKVKVKIIAP